MGDWYKEQQQGLYDAQFGMPRQQAGLSTWYDQGHRAASPTPPSYAAQGVGRPHAGAPRARRRSVGAPSRGDGSGLAGFALLVVLGGGYAAITALDGVLSSMRAPGFPLMLAGAIVFGLPLVRTLFIGPRGLMAGLGAYLRRVVKTALALAAGTTATIGAVLAALMLAHMAREGYFALTNDTATVWAGWTGALLVACAFAAWMFIALTTGRRWLRAPVTVLPLIGASLGALPASETDTRELLDALYADGITFLPR
ncbi:MAG: hypothetical protein AAGI34_02255 [Pseudomonadota bacterium]